MNQLLAFLNLYQHAKMSLFHVLFWDSQFLSPVIRLATPIFWQWPLKNLLISFQFLYICINMKKISLFHLFTLQIQPILESKDQIDHAHFWPYPTKKISINFYFMRICINMHKNEAVSWICFGQNVVLKILQSDWLRASRLILGTRFF